MSILHVTSVEVLDGRKLSLTFNDGSSGTADLEVLREHPYLRPVIEDDELFRRAHVDHGTVVWNDEYDIAAEYLHALANGLEPPRSLEDVTVNQVTVSMRQVRAASGKTQVEVAESMELSQADVSRLEARTDTKLSTLERYVRALGGELEVIVRLGRRTFRLGLGEQPRRPTRRSRAKKRAA